MSINNAFLGNDLVSNRIKKFFDEASIYVPNKYSVILHGKYVEDTIKYMQTSIESSSNDNIKYLNRINFNKWKVVYYDDVGKFLDLRWACSNVSIPTITTEVDNETIVDSTRTIKYPLIKGYKNGPLGIKITEDSKLMFYHFFNALNNQFFNIQNLKPNSSFQKLNIAIASFTGNEIFNPEKKNPIEATPSQVFEFNSSVLIDFGGVTLTNVSNNKLEYNITFNVPNAFQKSFNSSITPDVDNTSDRFFTKPQAGKITNVIDRNKFEISKDNLKFKR